MAKFLLVITKSINYTYTKYSKSFFLNEYKNPSNEKSWAMVTGASDGIGAEYCRTLALQGYNLIMVGRNYNKLTSV